MMLVLYINFHSLPLKRSPIYIKNIFHHKIFHNFLQYIYFQHLMQIHQHIQEDIACPQRPLPHAVSLVANFHQRQAVA